MRPQPFEDLNLAIRSFGTSPTLYGSVEEALAAFLEPEVLDGTNQYPNPNPNPNPNPSPSPSPNPDPKQVLDGANQYTCDKCRCSRDAFKGIKLTKLPRVLTIGLKRFDFDLSTLTRVTPHVHVRGKAASRQRRSAAAAQRRSPAAPLGSPGLQPRPPRTDPPGAGLAWGWASLGLG